MSAVAALANDTFQTQVLKAKGLVFVDFFAEWCGPCKMTGPIIDQLAEEYTDVTFYKVDVDANPDLASQFSVFSIPTFVIFRDGAVVTQFSGAMGKEGFETELKKVLGK